MRGRPRKNPDLKTDQQICVGVSKEIRTQLAMLADEKGVTVSKLVRDLILRTWGPEDLEV